VNEKFDRRPRGLKAPMCTECIEPMVWYRSTRYQEKPNLIFHYFQCPKCSDIREIMVNAPEAGAAN
jgi:hypothetical protein